MWSLLVLAAFAGDSWSAGLGANAATGNTSTVTASAFVNGGSTRGRHSFGARVDGQYGAAIADENNTGTTADDDATLKETQRNVGLGFDYAVAFGANASDDDAPPSPALFILADVEHRPTSGMALRPSTAVGIRLPVAKNPAITSFIEVGMVVASERYTEIAAEQAGKDSAKVLGAFLGHQATWPIGRASWGHRVGLVQNVLDTEDLRLDLLGSFDVPVTETVSVRLTSGARYDSKPVSDRYRSLDITSGVQFVLRTAAKSTTE